MNTKNLKIDPVQDIAFSATREHGHVETRPNQPFKAQRFLFLTLETAWRNNKMQPRNLNAHIHTFVERTDVETHREETS